MGVVWFFLDGLFLVFGCVEIGEGLVFVDFFEIGLLFVGLWCVLFVFGIGGDVECVGYYFGGGVV